ncbi:MAG: xanthine dehydrogenase family protein subunit M [Pseudolabrys sp.]
MKPAPFAYAKAKSVDQAIDLLGTADGEARLLAGGQSLMASLNMRLSHPSLLIDINGIGGLSGISVAKNRVSIGAMTRHVDAETSSDIAKHAPLIAKAMPHIAHPAIRNRGTIGGSVAFADPAAELPACMVALDADLTIKGPKGERSVKAADFFKGLFETALGAQDILTGVSLPAAGGATRTGFAELVRRHGDYAIVGLAAAGEAKGKGYDKLRLVFFGVGATPVRATKAEAALAAGDIDGAAKAVAADLDPPDDIQASGAAKRHLAGVLIKRVAAQLAEARS